MLSVLVPSFNHANYIEATIDSVRAIPVQGLQVIVIDDGSTDESVEVIQHYLDRTGPQGIQFVAKSANRGVIDTVNMFLGMCRTEYVYFTASDDITIATGIEQLVKRLESNSSLQFAIGGASNLYPDGSTHPVYGERHDHFFSLSTDEFLRALFLDCPSPILCQSSVFRRSAIESVGGFDQTLIADDYALFTKLFMRHNRPGHDFEFLPDIPCVHYRHHGVNSHRNLRRQATLTRQVLDAFAPGHLRIRAICYLLAYYTLIALSRGDFAAARDIAGSVPRSGVGWFLAGAVRSIAKKIARR